MEKLELWRNKEHNIFSYFLYYWNRSSLQWNRS